MQSLKSLVIISCSCTIQLGPHTSYIYIIQHYCTIYYSPIFNISLAVPCHADSAIISFLYKMKMHDCFHRTSWRAPQSRLSLTKQSPNFHSGSHLMDTGTTDENGDGHRLYLQLKHTDCQCLSDSTKYPSTPVYSAAQKSSQTWLPHRHS